VASQSPPHHVRIISLQYIIWISEDVSQDKNLIRLRCELVERVADMDNSLATLVIESESIEKIPVEEIENALKRIMMSNSGVPVLLGSSYKNIGVQPLMDAIVRYSG